MRAIGDVYVRKEFRTHMYGAKCSVSQFEKFLSGWRGYLEKLNVEKVTGENLDQNLLNDGQKKQLNSLKEEIKHL